MGDQNVTAAPSGTFDAADAPLNIAANRQEQFETLCDLVGRADLRSDPRFVDRDARKRHRDELSDELNKALRGRTAQEWEAALAAAGVPAARILTVPQVVESDQLTHRNFFGDLPFPGATAEGGHGAESPTEVTGRRLRVSGNGVLFDGAPLPATAPPPLLGEHNAQLPDLLAQWRDPHRTEVNR